MPISLNDYITVSRANATPLSGKNDNARTAPDTLRLLEDKEVEETLAQLARENEDIAGITVLVDFIY